MRGPEHVVILVIKVHRFPVERRQASELVIIPASCCRSGARMGSGIQGQISRVYKRSS